MDDENKKFFDLLQKWNKQISLTALDTYEKFQVKHLEDVLQMLPFLKGKRDLLDLGTGAGIPGIPIKILLNELEVVLLDSTRKKISFCEEAIRKLGLKNITAVWGRAEDEGIMCGLGAFDVVISRATWNLLDYIKIGIHYLGVNGSLFALKGSRWQEEIESSKKYLDKQGYGVGRTHEYLLSTGEQRAIVEIIKH